MLADVAGEDRGAERTPGDQARAVARAVPLRTGPLVHFEAPTPRRRSAVSGTTDLLKRLFIGRALASSRLGETLLPKRIALPVFCSDPISSVAYSTEQIVLVLGAARAASYLDLAASIAVA